MPISTAAVSAFNALTEEQARARVASCLAVPRWVDEVLRARPYDDEQSLLSRAEASASRLSDAELASALAGHPRIGDAPGNGHDREFSAREQSEVGLAEDEVRRRLAEGNRAYERRFGHVFLVRAAGRDAADILGELERRLGNDEATEREETVRSLREIALLRLEQVVAP
jgi:2-oxo-4-hydroxy-4-carboxy-5-ureidoimidazoline decarboxylase